MDSVNKHCKKKIIKKINDSHSHVDILYYLRGNYRHWEVFKSQGNVTSGFLQTASWLCGGLAAMEDIVQPLSDPVELRDVLQHFKTKRHKNRNGKPFVET